MRLSAFSPRRISLPPLPVLPRSFHTSFAPSNDPDITTDSLRKTLDTHRSSNRARLIRKVVPRAPAAGLFRPELPPETYAGYQPPTEAAAPPPPPPPPPPRQRESPKTGPGNREITRRLLRNKQPPADPRDDAIRRAQRGRPAQRPWLIYVMQHGESYLDAEIRALEEYLTPTSSEQEQLDQVRAKVCALLESIVPFAPQVIGSHRTGLALAHSGLEFIIPIEDRARSKDRRLSASRPQILNVHMHFLRRVENTLKSSPAFRQVHVLLGKTSTLLTAQHQPTGLSLRFTFGEGIPAITEYVQDSMAQYPALRSLYMTTRALLEARCLFGPENSGISSDALAILLVASLKINYGRFSDLGDQLLGFLELFGTEVDLRKVGVAVDPLDFFSAESLHTVKEGDNPEARRGQRSLLTSRKTALATASDNIHRLCIQDPTHYMKDLGRSCTRTHALQKCFAAAHEKLSHACDTGTDGLPAHSILGAALRVNFDELERRRGQLVSPRQQRTK